MIGASGAESRGRAFGKDGVLPGPSKRIEQLGIRVYQLEQRIASPDHPDGKFLQTQLDRLHPALKSLRFSDFKSNGIQTKASAIPRFFSDHMPELAQRISLNMCIKVHMEIALSHT